MYIIIIIIFITITQQPEQDRWAENQPTAGLSSLNKYEYGSGMRRSKTELVPTVYKIDQIYAAHMLSRVCLVKGATQKKSKNNVKRVFSSFLPPLFVMQI